MCFFFLSCRRYLLFQGFDAPAVVSQKKPEIPKAKKDESPIPVAIIQIEDSDLMNFMSGGLTVRDLYFFCSHFLCAPWVRWDGLNETSLLNLFFFTFNCVLSDRDLAVSSVERSRLQEQWNWRSSWRRSLERQRAPRRHWPTSTISAASQRRPRLASKKGLDRQSTFRLVSTIITIAHRIYIYAYQASSVVIFFVVSLSWLSP